MPEITAEQIIKIIEDIDNPSLKTLNEVLFDGKNIRIDLEMSSPTHHVKNKIKQQIMDTLLEKHPSLAGVSLEIVTTEAKPATPEKPLLLPKVKNTIAVASGKGGVGKSTVAVNLAIALAKANYKVGLIDADIYGPSIPLMLGTNEQPEVFSKLNEKKLKPIEKFGVKLMSIGFLIDEDNPVIWRGPMASGAVKQFLTDVDWGELDYMIIDLPPGTGDIQLTLVQTIPLTGSVIVTTPQNVSLVDARKGLKMFERVNVPVFGIIENMSYFIAPDTGKRYDIFGSGGGENLSKELNTPYLGGIPIEQKIREGGDNGSPIVQTDSDNESAKSLMEISKNLANRVENYNLKTDSSNVEIIL
jgi:ATP-binding protein involved in chromosome partitioning